MENLTICIPTHCIKIEASGQYTGIQQIIPSAPSAKLVYTVIADLLSKSNLSHDIKILIGFDKRKNRSVDDEYETNLKLLQIHFPNLKVIVSETESTDPIVTAPMNFKKLIDSVTTEFYLFWEHDWIFNHPVDVKTIIDEMVINKKINWIKFNQFSNNNDVVQFIPEELKTENPSSTIPLIPTTRWSNNPYICRTKVFTNWWRSFIYDTYEEGGFVEGPLNVFYKYYLDKQGLRKTHEEFKCFIYGKWNDDPIVSHLNGYRVI